MPVDTVISMGTRVGALDVGFSVEGLFDGINEVGLDVGFSDGGSEGAEVGVWDVGFSVIGVPDGALVGLLVSL